MYTIAMHTTMRGATLVIALITTACGGSPTSPGGEQERFTWTVNGESFTATSNGLGALRSATGGTCTTTTTSPDGTVVVSTGPCGAKLFLDGADCNRKASLNIQILSANVMSGTYSVGDKGANVTWTPDARTSDTARERWIAPGFAIVGAAVVSLGSGSVTISNISSEWVSGRFSFEVVPDSSNQDTSAKTLQGSFELSFRERTIC